MTDSTEELSKRLARLESENAELKATLAAAVRPDSGVVVVTARPRRHGVRAAVSAILVTIALLLVPTGIVASWASTQLSDTDRFVETFAPLASDPAVQSAVVNGVVTEVNKQIDIPGLVSDAFGALDSLDLPANAKSALKLLEGPAVNGIQSVLTSTTQKLVESQAFADIWAQVLRTAHTQLTGALNGDSSSAVVLSSNGELSIQLGPIIDAVKTQLINAGVGFASAIPSINKSIVVAQSDQLASVSTYYHLAVDVGMWIPWILLALLIVGIAVAVHRWRTLVVTGIALAAVTTLFGIAISIARPIFGRAVSSEQFSSAAAISVYDVVVESMTTSALALGAIGVLAAIVGFLAGPFVASVAIRSAFNSLAAHLRTWAEGHGITTGAVGEWMYRQRMFLRIAIGLIAAIIILVSRPLSVSVIVWTAVIALIVLVLEELAQRPPSVVVPLDSDGDHTETRDGDTLVIEGKTTA